MILKGILLYPLPLIVFYISCTSRSKINPEQIDYPGDRLATDTAQLFAPGIVSTDAFEHSSPAISPDGRTILWSVVALPSWKSSILEMNYENGIWNSPHHVSFIDTTFSNIYPSFSPIDQDVYFSSDKDIPGDSRNSRGNVLWRVARTSDGWSIPKPLDSIVSQGGDYAPTFAANGDLYFTHGPFRSPDWDIRVSKNKGKEAPASLSAINTRGYEDGAFISPDEAYLIFESDRPGGKEGSIDLYISFKGTDSSWITPINMGEKINTKASERFARVSPDGQFLFFGSNRRLVNGEPNFDIYWIRAAVIEELRRKIAE